MAGEPEQTILTVMRTGGRYHAAHVHWLRDQCQRMAQRPFRFVCLSDDPAVPGFTRLRDKRSGWWAKLEAFRPDIAAQDARVLYLDLDTVVMRPFRIPVLPVGVLGMLELGGTWYTKVGSGLMAWTHPLPAMAKWLAARVESFIDLLPGDQEAILAAALACGVTVVRIRHIAYVQTVATPPAVPYELPPRRSFFCFAGDGPKPWDLTRDWIPPLPAFSPPSALPARRPAGISRIMPPGPALYRPDPISATGTLGGHPNSVPPDWPCLAGNHAAATAAPSQPRTAQTGPPCAVAVTSHGAYLQYLPECLAAIEAQAVQPSEKYLALDRCELSRQQADDLRARGWTISIGNWGSPNPGRQWALETTRCPWIWHVDADDPHRPDYLAGALPLTADTRVAIVHADRAKMDGTLLKTPAGTDYWALRLQNYVDTSSLWRVHALREAGGWADTKRWDDWDCALRVTALGWQTVRNSVPSVCRVHPDRTNRNAAEQDFAHKWNRSYGVVCLLAGRMGCWADWRAAVLACDYPPCTHFYLLDNSRSAVYAKLVRSLASDLLDRGLSTTVLVVPETFVANGPSSRHEWVAHLYNLLLPKVTQDVMLSWEDDNIPKTPQPVRVLVDHWVCYEVGGICAAYECRGHEGSVCAATAMDYWHGMPAVAALRGAVHKGYGFLPGGFALYNNALVRRALPFWVQYVPEGKMQGWDGQLSRCVRANGYRLDLDGTIDCEHRWRENP